MRVCCTCAPSIMLSSRLEHQDCHHDAAYRPSYISGNDERRCTSAVAGSLNNSICFFVSHGHGRGWRRRSIYQFLLFTAHFYIFSYRDGGRYPWERRSSHQPRADPVRERRDGVRQPPLRGTLCRFPCMTAAEVAHQFPLFGLPGLRMAKRYLGG